MARDLRNNAVTDREGAGYMMLSAFLYTQANYSALWFGGYRDWAFLFEALMVLLISVIGVHECFKANGGDMGVSFLMRFCALAVPIGVKIAVVGMALGQAVYYGFPYVVGHGTFRDAAFVYRVISFTMALTFTFVYYWRIAYHLAAIRRTLGGAEEAL